MTKSELIVNMASLSENDPRIQKLSSTYLGDCSNFDELLTAQESCQYLKISRTTLWRKFAPTMKIGSLPRWTKAALLNGGLK